VITDRTAAMAEAKVWATSAGRTYVSRFTFKLPDGDQFSVIAASETTARRVLEFERGIYAGNGIIAGTAKFLTREEVTF
jgi:hypothetical protein